MRKWLQETFWMVSIEPMEEEYVERVTDIVLVGRSFSIATYRHPGDGRRVRYRFGARSDN